MKKIIVLIGALTFSVMAYAQVDTISTNIYQLDGKLGIGTNAPSHEIELKGKAESNAKEELIKINLENDSESSLIIGNSTFDDNYFVPSIKGYSVAPNLPGLVLRGIAPLENDNTGDALIHITPYILSGSDLKYPKQRHFLGIQGYETGYGQKSLFEIDEKGYIGIGTENPYSKLHVSDGDIYIEDIEKGIIMKSPDGTCWRGVMSNTGELVFSEATCPESVSTSKIDKSISTEYDSKVYPNPGSDEVYVKYSKKIRNGEYKIYNLNGQLKSNGKLRSNSQPIHISDLPKGIYVLNVFDKKGNVLLSEKIIKK